MSQQNLHHSVYALLLYQMGVWGLNLVVLKMLTGYFDVVFLSLLRVGVAFLCITILTWHRFGKIPPVSTRQSGWLAATALLMVYAHQISFALGLQRSTATNAGLILALAPLLSAALEFWVFRERIDAVRVAGIALGFAGVSLVILSGTYADFGLSGMGDIVLLVSMACYVGGGFCLRKVAAEVHPLSLTWYLYLFGTGMLMMHAAFTPGGHTVEQWFPSLTAWGLILVSALFASTIGNVVWSHAIAQVGLGRATLFLNWVPVFSLLFAATFLAEPVSLVQIAGLIGVLLGSLLGVRTAGEPVSN